MMMSKVPRSLVACNIYVSAGGHPSHRELLLGLLGETQEHCRRVNNAKDNANSKSTALNPRVVVVHAFRDGPYDRSSFHLAGAPDMVADVGSSLAVNAVQALMRLETTDTTTNRVGDQIEVKGRELSGGRHPTVGLVDHVSVLSLDENSRNNDKNEITGSVAQNIGKSLESVGADVLYYGDAHPSRKELAAVRRESTRFFEGNKTANDGARAKDDTNTTHAGQATVGAPQKFVENFNIRLRKGITRKVARTLTESVRECSGKGLPFVEALTLAYGRDQYEVACNLLDPSVTSSRDIEDRTNHWEQQQNYRGGDSSSGLIESAYRVGTTTEMCLKALRDVSTAEGEMAHNRQVLERLQNDFL